ncbi:MAG: hypothetical protein HKN74_11500, partial [Acidimicrobiia bacterium]|nr:hypothetical protein [Acidimicrobiia bacterium]
MYAPLRLVYGLRPHASLGLLLAALTATFMFVLTPFAIPDVAFEFDIAVGTAGLISTAQVGGFGLANVLAGRRLMPSAGLLRTGIGVLV